MKVAGVPSISSSSKYASLIESSECPEQGVRIWSAELDALSPIELGELESFLDAGERARAGRFHFERDRKHYIAARGFLRQLLGDALEIPPSLVELVYGRHGKPMLAEKHTREPTLRFNLSHSAGWAVFALAWNREVGIDLESTTRLALDDTHLAALAGRILSARELRIWQALPDLTARHAAFLRAWTRKEAYAKATGEGVFEGLGKVEAILDAAAPAPSQIIASAAAGERAWVVHDLRAPDQFLAALAVAQSSGPPR